MRSRIQCTQLVLRWRFNSGFCCSFSKHLRKISQKTTPWCTRLFDTQIIRKRITDNAPSGVCMKHADNEPISRFSLHFAIICQYTKLGQRKPKIYNYKLISSFVGKIEVPTPNEMSSWGFHKYNRHVCVCACACGFVAYVDNFYLHRDEMISFSNL